LAVKDEQAAVVGLVKEEAAASAVVSAPEVATAGSSASAASVPVQEDQLLIGPLPNIEITKRGVIIYLDEL
jgi:type III secretion system FlhB-like substrate exporter